MTLALYFIVLAAFAVIFTLEVIVQLMRIGERIGRRLHDRRRKRIAELGSRLAAMHRQGAETEIVSFGAGRGGTLRFRCTLGHPCTLACRFAH